MRKKFKRYFAKPDCGKGSERRDADVSEKVVGERWCLAVGHRFKYGICLNCGTKEPTPN